MLFPSIPHDVTYVMETIVIGPYRPRSFKKKTETPPKTETDQNTPRGVVEVRIKRDVGMNSHSGHVPCLDRRGHRNCRVASKRILARPFKWGSTNYTHTHIHTYHHLMGRGVKCFARMGLQGWKKG